MLLYPFQIIYSAEAHHKMAKVLENFAPDIVHLNNFNYQLTPSVIYAVRAYEKKTGRTVKIALTAHDMQLVCPNHTMYNPSEHKICEKCINGAYYHCIKGKCIHFSRLRSILGAIEGWLYRRLDTYRHIDLTIYPSRFISTKLNTNRNLAKNYKILHNFVTDNPKKEYKKDDYVLYFGRFSKEKGVETLIQACKELPWIPFKFAGTGELETLFKGIPNIENMGFQSGEALAEMIGRARFTIMPSEGYENCPFSILESLYYGTPVIGADIGGIPELIDQGRTGLLFESGNKEDLKEKIAAMWTDKALLKDMHQNCAGVSFETVKTYCEKLVEYYEKLLPEGKIRTYAYENSNDRA